MAELSDRFVLEARERAEEIEGLLSASMTTDDGSSRADEIREQAHKIKGAAGIFGFDQLKVAASALEDAAKAGRPPDELRAAFNALCAAIPG